MGQKSLSTLSVNELTNLHEKIGEAILGTDHQTARQFRNFRSIVWEELQMRIESRV
jgi:hypothetical protein